MQYLGKPVFALAGTHSGSGKTTISLGIMAALIKRGFSVQPFKVGPDFIDPGHHRRITGKDSCNLDGWMLSKEYNQKMFTNLLSQAQAGVVEGVMGLFDGFSGNQEDGSTAQMAKWLNLPVILIVQAKSMARSAAALIHGYTTFDPDLSVKGVIFNQVGGPGHKSILKESLSGSNQPKIYGFLPKEDSLAIPSRHLGLVTDEDLDQPRKEQDRHLAAWIEKHLDLNQILEDTAYQDKIHSSYQIQENIYAQSMFQRPFKIRIGVAKDRAFCFYYPENFRLLEETGAELVPFSPLASQKLPPNLQGIYLGGGYPELYCRQLSDNNSLLESIKDFALQGRPIYAECGGFMYLMQDIKGVDGLTYPMAGVFALTATMQKRFQALGYREITTSQDSLLGPAKTVCRGHEFHYSKIEKDIYQTKTIYHLTGRKDLSHNQEGYLVQNTLGSYVHLHWGSNPAIANNFLNYCQFYG